MRDATTTSPEFTDSIAPVHEATDAPSRPGPALNVDLRRLNTTDRDAAWYEFSATACLAIIWSLLIGAMAGWLPVWVLAAAPVLYIRYELNAHELIHCRSGKQLNPLMRFMPVCQSLYHMSYDGYRLNHLDHHRFLDTEHDPEAYIAQVPSWRAFFRAMGCIEVAAFRYVRLYHRDFTWRNYLEGILKAALFIALLAWNWPVFLIYFASLRVTTGVADFFFHHCLHTDDHPVAVAFRRINAACPWLFGWLLGYDKVAILLWHDAHHDHPLVAARNLPQVEAANA